MEIFKTQKAFVIIIGTLLLHSSSVCLGQKLSPQGATKGSSDPTVAPPLILPPTEDNEEKGPTAAAASISNQRLPFSKALKGQSDSSPLELQQAAQGLSYQQEGSQNQPAFGSGLTQQPLSGPNQPFSSLDQPFPAGTQNSLTQSIPFRNGVEKQKTRTHAAVAALISSIIFTVFLALLF